jgi:hypothetical protein
MEDGIVLIEEQSADIFENSKLQINIFRIEFISILFCFFSHR